MKEIRLNGSTYHICAEWGDIDRAMVVKILNLPMPEKLKRAHDIVYVAHLSYREKDVRLTRLVKTYTPEEEYKVFPQYFIELIAILSDIPMDVLRKTSVVMIKEIQATYIQKFTGLILCNVGMEFISN